MSWDSWSCLMVEKGPGIIEDDVRTALKAAACNLHLQRIDRMRVISGACEGVIQTNWDAYAVGTLTGIFFRAQIEHESGDYYVNFLLNKKDLEAGAEIIRQMEEDGFGRWDESHEQFPVEELYQFHDLRKRKLN